MIKTDTIHRYNNAVWFYFLTNTTTPPQAVWTYSSGCSLRGPLRAIAECKQYKAYMQLIIDDN